MAEIPTDTLRVALLPFAAGADPTANRRTIAAGLDAAAEAGAQVLLTPECALPGYPGGPRVDFADLDWRALAGQEEALLHQAERHGILLVLGSAERRPDGVSNDAVLGGAIPSTRYRKRCLTPGDRSTFVPGDRPLLIEAFGWRFGVAICYDLRFAPSFHDLAAAGADAFLVIAHMAGIDPDPGTKATVVPTLVATRAAEWATPLAFCNTAAPDRWCASCVVDARGVVQTSSDRDLVVADLRRRESHPTWYADLRREHLARWSSP